MARILTPAECEKVKVIRKQFEPYAEKGWMCEGSEYDSGRRIIICNCIFNNQTDEYFLADYRGNILSKDLKRTSIEDAREMARIQGEIMNVVGE